MGAPPEGKGGKKGPPPPAQNGDAQGKAKGKGPPPAKTPGHKVDAFQIWLEFGGEQHQDGHWEGDFLVGPMPYCALPLFQTDDEKAAFLADCPFLSTLIMLHLGQKAAAMLFSNGTKQVREVKIGDGRGNADEVETKQVELSDEEKARGREEFESFCERCKITTGWEERAEAYLSSHPLSEQRDAFKERVQAVLANTKLEYTTSKDREAARPRVNTDERLKREEARKEKEAAIRKKEEDILADKKKRMAHMRSLAPADINAIQWSKAKDLHFVEGGSGGVLLVDLQESCVVLKIQGRTAANEMLAEHVADAVGVSVAHVRVVKKGDKEAEDIFDASKNCQMFGTDPVMGFGFFFGHWDRAAAPITKVLDQAAHDAIRVSFYGVLQYAQGHSLMGLDGNEAMKAPTPDLLHELGCLCALDVLINNLDRVPLPVWQNEGNLGNVMVINAGSSILGIDQQVNWVLEGQGRDGYLEKVVKVVTDSKPSGDSKGISAKLQQTVLENCGSELSGTNAQHIVDGMHKGFKQITDAFTSGKIQQSLDEGEKKCFERLIIDGSCSGTKPVLDRLDAMKEFVCAVASQIADEMGTTK